MTDNPTGPDLARLAFNQWRATAKQRPAASGKKRPRRVRTDRTGGRDPRTFGGIVEELATAYNWRRPSTAGLLMARWPELAPALAKLATPERFDAETGTLHLRPVSAAAGTKLGWEAPRIPAALNTALGSDTVTAVQILTPGTLARPRSIAQPTEERPSAGPAPSPPRTREDAPVGFHRALEAHRSAVTTNPHADPHQAARDRRFGDIRNSLREPAEAFTDALEATSAGAEPTGGNTCEQSRQAAVKRARDERAGRTPAVPTAFQRTA